MVESSQRKPETARTGQKWQIMAKGQLEKPKVAKKWQNLASKWPKTPEKQPEADSKLGEVSAGHKQTRSLRATKSGHWCQVHHFVKHSWENQANVDVFVSSASTLSQVFSMLYWLDLELGKPNHVETSVKWDVKREQGKSGQCFNLLWISSSWRHLAKSGTRVLRERGRAGPRKVRASFGCWQLFQTLQNLRLLFHGAYPRCKPFSMLNHKPFLGGGWSKGKQNLAPFGKVFFVNTNVDIQSKTFQLLQGGNSSHENDAQLGVWGPQMHTKTIKIFKNQKVGSKTQTTENQKYPESTFTSAHSNGWSTWYLELCSQWPRKNPAGHGILSKVRQSKDALRKKSALISGPNFHSSGVSFPDQPQQLG